MNAPFILTTKSADHTRLLGKTIGQSIQMDQSGIRIALVGDLGSGKTIFVQGLAIGVGVLPDTYITSPTYTLINEYTGRWHLYHADLYRLASTEEMALIGLNEILASYAVVAIEWADRLDEISLGDHLLVNIQITKQDQRQITLIAYGRSHQILLNETEKIYGAISWD